jgi:hypothetical protein
VCRLRHFQCLRSNSALGADCSSKNYFGAELGNALDVIRHAADADGTGPGNEASKSARSRGSTTPELLEESDLPHAGTGPFRRVRWLERVPALPDKSSREAWMGAAPGPWRKPAPSSLIYAEL